MVISILYGACCSANGNILHQRNLDYQVVAGYQDIFFTKLSHVWNTSVNMAFSHYTCRKGLPSPQKVSSSAKSETLWKDVNQARTLVCGFQDMNHHHLCCPKWYSEITSDTVIHDLSIGIRSKFNSHRELKGVILTTAKDEKPFDDAYFAALCSLHSASFVQEIQVSAANSPSGG